MAERRGLWVKGLTKDDKASIAATCERFITEVLIPRFLPEIRPTEFNYPIAITGKWRGDKYSFIQRYCSGFADSAGEEFDSAFARITCLPLALVAGVGHVMVLQPVTTQIAPRPAAEAAPVTTRKGARK